MRLRLAGFAAAGVCLALVPAARAAEPIDLRLTFGQTSPIKDSFELGGLKLTATCTAVFSNDQAMKLVATSSHRPAYVSASLSEVNDPVPSTPRDSNLKPGEKLVLIEQGQLEGVGGTVSYSDSKGNQVSAVIHAETYFENPGVGCQVGGTASKGKAIDYRADVGSSARKIVSATGVKLKASCEGTNANPKLDLRVASGDPLVDVATSWSQRGHPNSLTTILNPPSGDRDPLNGAASQSEGTMVLGYSFHPRASLVFQADAGNPLGGDADCLFGGTLETGDSFYGTKPKDAGAETSLFQAAFTGRYACQQSAEPTFVGRANFDNGLFSVSYSQVNNPNALTIADGDADLGEAVSAFGGAQGASGTMVLSGPDGRQASAIFELVDRGTGCLAAGNVISAG